MSTLFLETDNDHHLLQVDGYSRAPWTGPTMFVVSTGSDCYGPFVSRDEANLMLADFPPDSAHRISIFPLRTRFEPRDIMATPRPTPVRHHAPAWWVQRNLSNPQRAFFEVIEEETPERAWWMDIDSISIPDEIRDRINAGCPTCEGGIELGCYVSTYGRETHLTMACSDDEECGWDDSYIVRDTPEGHDHPNRHWQADHLNRWIELWRLGQAG